MGYRKTKSKSRRDIFVLALLAVGLTVILFVVSRFSSSTINRSGAAPVVNLAILGDSISDEYRADDNRGGSFSQTTFNWAEMIAKKSEFNLGKWGCRPSPRRCGYEYNWALSGATSGSLISSGQHTGAASQISNGLVDSAIIIVGVNDFYQVASGIMAGTMSSTQITAFVNNMVSNVSTAVNTLQASGSVRIILVGVNLNNNFFTTDLPDPVMRSRMIAALQKYNTGLISLSQNSNVSYWDSTEVFDEMFSGLINNTYHQIGGVNINVRARSNEPHNLLLADNPWVHIGTVVSGKYANYIITKLNADFGLNIPSFTDSEILTTAGILNVQTQSPTVTPTKTPSPTPVPTKTPTVSPKPTPTMTLKPTITPTKSPMPIATPTFRPTPTSTPVSDPLKQYCGTYRSLRYLLLRFFTASQIREWDTRCSI